MQKKQESTKNMPRDDSQPTSPFAIPEVYANAALVNISPYEIEVTLGLGSGIYEGVRPVVNIRLSPLFAKELAGVLNENISLYEANFGEIKTREGKQ